MIIECIIYIGTPSQNLAVEITNDHDILSSKRRKIFYNEVMNAGNLIDLEEKRAKKKDKSVEEQKMFDRQILLLVDYILEWWEANKTEEQPEFVRIVKEIFEVGVLTYIEEQIKILREEEGFDD